MREIRVKVRREIASHPSAAEGWDTSITDEKHLLSDDDAIVSHITTLRQACECNCLKPAAGYCVCRRIICLHCFTRCWNCERPLGPCCRRKGYTTSGEEVSLCQKCRGRLWAKKAVLWAKKVIQGALSPVVTFKE
jgi:hypothetical protein